MLTALYWKTEYIYIYINEHIIFPPPIKFKIRNTVHFNNIFQNEDIRRLLLAFQYMGKDNKKGGVMFSIAP